MSKQQTNSHRPFDFLKGNDQQFDNAMKSISITYDDMFGDESKYDKMFETFKTENNPITACIDQMSSEIFDLDKPKQQQYIKVENDRPQNSIKIYPEDEQQSVVLGDPVYMNPISHKPFLYYNNNEKNPYYQK